MLEDEDVTAPEAAEETIPQEGAEDKSVEETMELAKEADVSEEEEDKEGKEGKEEAKQEEKEPEPPPEHPRFKKVYGDLKRSERKTDSLQKEVDKLKTLVNGVSEERTQEKQKEADDEIGRLWADHAEAMTELDGAKASKIYRKIDALERKKTAQPKAAPKEDEIDKKVIEREDARAVEQFKKRNPWFNKDSENYSSKMRKYAIAAEQDLTESGFEGSLSDLLLEVEKDVNETFKPKRSSGLPSVAGVNPTKRIATSKPTNLTDEMKALAYAVYSGIPKAEAEAKYSAILKKQGGTR